MELIVGGFVLGVCGSAWIYLLSLLWREEI
jgi:hypothetical protein